MSIIAVPEDKVVAFRQGVALQDVKLVDSVVTEALRAQVKDFMVLRQSIPAGAAVPRGTTVDVVVAVTRDLSGRVSVNVHNAYSKQAIGLIADKVGRSDPVINVLANNPTSTTLSAEDKDVLVSFARESGVNIDNADEDQIGQLFDTYMGAFVMGGG